MSPRCPRTWEVSAARDERLGSDAREDLEGHAQRCQDCANEHRALATLQARLRGMTVPEPDDLTVRRLRGRVLGAADAATVRERGTRRQPLVAALAGVAVVVAILIGWQRRSAPLAQLETQVLATDEGRARWSSREVGEARHIDLLDGALGLWVDRPRDGKQVVVRMPDGEIEDIGTVFHVKVADGHTRQVRVDVGSVVLRLDGQPARTLRAGQSWEQDEQGPPSPQASPTPPPSQPPPAIAPATSLATARRTFPAPPSPSGAASGGTTAPHERDGARASSSEAAEEEDRAYVEVIRLLHAGHDAEAHAAARDYARRFPRGFRRREIDQLLAAPLR